ncbi:CU044_2847 family protein [Streptomyces sp. NPDC101151]|uniref:CU044_2847 family protein n=1 Tax=Streptomyces sp. NPDC101151 TaxID=3366115 RepID=UPI0038253296
MAQYIEFGAGEGEAVLIEVSGTEDTRSDGTVKAGVRDRLQGAVAIAQTTLDESLTCLVRANARVFVEAVRDVDPRPAELEVNFGIKATGEVGNLAVAKAAGEASYSVRMLWRNDPS